MRSTLALFTLAALLALGGRGQAATGADAACQNLRLSLLPYPGYYERASDGSMKGLDVDIARELAARSGCSFEISATNTTRLWPALQAGQVDLTAGAAFLPERLADADFLWLIRGRPAVMMDRAQSQATPTRAAFDADPRLKLGVTRGARRGAQSQAWVDALRAQGRISESTDMPSLLRAYAAGRVDAVLILPGSLQGQSEAWLAEHPLLDWLPQDRLTAGWALSRRGVPEPQRQNLIDAARTMRLDGTLLRLLRQHFGEVRAYEFLAAPAASEPSP